MAGTHLSADAEGIWRMDEGLPRIGRAWNELVSILAHRLRPNGDEVLVLDLEDMDGDSFVITDRLAGFAEVVAAMPNYLPGLEAGFLEPMQADSAMADPRELWRLV